MTLRLGLYQPHVQVDENTALVMAAIDYFRGLSGVFHVRLSYTQEFHFFGI